MERLPAVSRPIIRSPVRSNTCIFWNVETRSMPALVRESETRVRPSSTRIPTQYLMKLLRALLLTGGLLSTAVGRIRRLRLALRLSRRRLRPELDLDDELL